MTNYQEGQDPYAQGGGAAPQGGGHYEGAPQQGGAGYGGQGAYAPQQTSQFAAAPAGGQWSGGQSHHNPMSGHNKRISVKNSLKSTEFWVLVLVSLALLIAAAVADENAGNGFSAQDAWRYVTVLAAAYILSRGLAKFGGRDEESDDHHGHH